MEYKYKLKRFLDEGLNLDQLTPDTREIVNEIIYLSRDEVTGNPFADDVTAVKLDLKLFEKRYDELLQALPPDSLTRQKHEFEQQKQSGKTDQHNDIVTMLKIKKTVSLTDLRKANIAPAEVKDYWGFSDYPDKFSALGLNFKRTFVFGNFSGANYKIV